MPAPRMANTCHHAAGQYFRIEGWLDASVMLAWTVPVEERDTPAVLENRVTGESCPRRLDRFGSGIRLKRKPRSGGLSGMELRAKRYSNGSEMRVALMGRNPKTSKGRSPIRLLAVACAFSVAMLAQQGWNNHDGRRLKKMAEERRIHGDQVW